MLPARQSRACRTDNHRTLTQIEKSMHSQYALLVIPLLIICTGCPDTWRKGGKMDRAMAKDIQQMTDQKDCPLDEDEFEYRCETEELWEARSCPPECQ
jgi:hypothetical protein